MVLIICMIISIWNKPKPNPSLLIQILSCVFCMVSPVLAKGSFRANFCYHNHFSVPLLDNSMWLFTAAAQPLCTAGRQEPLLDTAPVGLFASLVMGNASSFIKWPSTASSFESQGFWTLSDPSQQQLTDSTWTMRWTFAEHPPMSILLLCTSNMFW